MLACSESPQPSSQAEDAAPAEAVTEQRFAVDATRIIQADDEPGNWLSHGRTYDEQRFSPLEQVNTDNVNKLGLDWFFEFETHRGMEATPIVVDGVMFLTGAWSRVYALDARNGSLLWKYDPEVPPAWALHACCDVVNRGVAIWQGAVFVGPVLLHVLDRLIKE